jgi:hypothetical protein
MAVSTGGWSGTAFAVAVALFERDRHDRRL